MAQFRHHTDREPSPLRFVLPAGPGQRDGLGGQRVQIQRRQVAGVVRRAVQRLQPADRLGGVHSGRQSALEILAGPTGLVLQFQECQAAEAAYRGEQVVEIVGHAAGHLPQRAQLLRAHEGALRPQALGDVRVDGQIQPATLKLEG